MKVYTKEDLDKYLENDWILPMVEKDHPGVANQWLLNQPQRRMIYADLYGELLNPLARKKILDIGCGHSSITDRLAQLHDYHGLDTACATEYIRPYGWSSFPIGEPVDIVIANDLFPNVDQRLELFLKTFHPICKEIWLTLTIYNEPRFIPVQAVRTGELLVVRLQRGDYCYTQIFDYLDNIIDFDFSCFENTKSIYANGRTVIRCDIEGAL